MIEFNLLPLLARMSNCQHKREHRAICTVCAKAEYESLIGQFIGAHSSALSDAINAVADLCRHAPPGLSGNGYANLIREMEPVITKTFTFKL